MLPSSLLDVCRAVQERTRSRCESHTWTHLPPEKDEHPFHLPLLLTGPLAVCAVPGRRGSRFLSCDGGSGAGGVGDEPLAPHTPTHTDLVLPPHRSCSQYFSLKNILGTLGSVTQNSNTLPFPSCQNHNRPLLSSEPCWSLRPRQPHPSPLYAPTLRALCTFA